MTGEVRADPAHRFEPFPLTATQQAYVLGRRTDFDLGGVAARGYYEYDGLIDPERLTAAWRRLIDRHEALRTVVDVEHGVQRFLPEVPEWAPTVHDLRGLTPSGRAARLARLREQGSHRVADPGKWPLFEVGVSLLDERATRLHVGFDGLCFDYLSWKLLMAELEVLYADPAAPLPELRLSFRDYVLTDPDPEALRRAEGYWMPRIERFPAAPPLPGCRLPAGPVRFTRRESAMPPGRWSALVAGARRARVTPTALMAAAFAEVIVGWSGEHHFTLNMPAMNRMPLHPDVDRVVGEFASISLLEVDHRAPTFRGRAQAIQRRLWADLEHSVFTGLRVLRELARAQGDPTAARMPVVLTSTLGWSDGARRPLAGALREVYAISQTPQVSLDVQIHEHAGELYFNWDTVDAAYPPGLLDAMFAAFTGLLDRLADDEALWDAREVGLRPDAAPIRGPEATGLGQDDRALAHDALRERAAERPDAVALITGEGPVRYGELAARADRIARGVAAHGIGPDDVVALVLDRGCDQIAAVHGILTAGAAYAPLDPEWPPQRLHEVLQGLAPALVLADRELPGALRIDELADGPAPHARPTPDHLAVVITTSGTTGKPKAVEIAHRGIVAACADTIATHGLGPADRSLAVSALHHDMSGFDVFAVLGAGGTVVVPEQARARDAHRWAALAREHGVTVWNSVPAMAEMLLAADGLPPTLRVVTLGGDWVPPVLARRLAAAGVDVFAIGGPTETTLWNIRHPARDLSADATTVPYGRPLPGWRYHLLDRDLRPCPEWVPGEMYCSGPGVARGYRGDPALTAARFVPHVATGERLYRTGDLGRLLPDGTMEFLGRADLQIELRGQRIEPGEIEAALRRQPGVGEAVVVPVPAAEGPGIAALAGYVTGQADPDALRDGLRKVLPEQLVPATLTVVDAFPLTRNGKIDRAALAARGLPTGPESEPTTALDAVVTAVWSDELRLTGVPAGASFYALGGDSVSATRVLGVLRAVLDAPDLSLRPLLGAPDAAAYAAALRRDDPDRLLEEAAAIYLDVLALDPAELDRELQNGEPR